MKSSPIVHGIIKDGKPIFIEQNTIELVWGTLIKLDVRTLWITMQLGFCQMISLANNSGSSKTELGIKSD
jgi:hypothetical protein